MASSVYKSLQCLISALTQRGKGGHLFRLTCSVVLWGGRNTTNKYHWHVWECSQCMDHTGFAPTQGVCAFPVYTAQAPGCSAGDQPPNVGPAFRALPRSKLPGFSFSSTPQTHRQWSMCFVPFPGPSSSGDQVLGEHAIPGGLCVLITSPVPAPWFPGCTARAVSQVSHISPPGSDPPGRCQPSQMPGRLG